VLGAAASTVRPVATGTPGAGGAAGESGLPSPSVSANGAAPDVDLIGLGDVLGQRVRVGGLVTELLADGFGLDDGTAVGRVVLDAPAALALETLAVGDALNATGIPELRDGVVVIVIADAADVELVGVVMGAAGTGTEQLGEPAPSAPLDDEAVRASIGRGMGLDPASAGLGTLALMAAVSVAVTLGRRLRAQRVLRRRIVARLEAIGRLGTPPS
jgi:hypothetical protein